MQRTILHVDANNFYASVECLYRPELRDRPVVVCGDPELRHGIVLSKNYPAKACGIVTAEPLGAARKKCPDLVPVVADFSKYQRFTEEMREIFRRYTDCIEPYGSDEAFLDVSASAGVRGEGKAIADDIRNRVRRQLGITCSAGVADNKPFAKLGSDMKKPDATAVLSPQDYPNRVWPLPAGDLLFVGRATQHKLYQLGLLTIGDVASTSRVVLRTLFGKNGDSLWTYANGRDTSPVVPMETEVPILSVGNSTTTPVDLLDEGDVLRTLCVLVESVAYRLRKHHLQGRVVHVRAVDTDLVGHGRQGTLTHPTQLSDTILTTAPGLFRASYPWVKPVRNVGVTVSGLTSSDGEQQLSFLPEVAREARALRLEQAKDDIRNRFGHLSIQRACLLEPKPLSDLQNNHLMFPTSRTS